MNYLEQYILNERTSIALRGLLRAKQKSSQFVNKAHQIVDSILVKDDINKKGTKTNEFLQKYYGIRLKREDEDYDISKAITEFAEISYMKKELKQTIYKNIDYVFDEYTEALEDNPDRGHMKAGKPITGWVIKSLYYMSPGSFGDLNKSLFLYAKGTGEARGWWARKFNAAPESWKKASDEAREDFLKALAPMLVDEFIPFVQSGGKTAKKETDKEGWSYSADGPDGPWVDGPESGVSPDEAAKAGYYIKKGNKITRNGKEITTDALPAATTAAAQAVLPPWPAEDPKRPWYCPNNEPHNKIFCSSKDLWKLEARNLQMFKANGGLKTGRPGLLRYLKEKKKAGSSESAQIKLIKARIAELEAEYLKEKKADSPSAAGKTTAAGAGQSSRPIKAKVKRMSKSRRQAKLSKDLNFDLAVMQSKLKARGYLAPGSNTFKSGGPDGKYGPETEGAIKDLQRDLGFTGAAVDGLWGSKTMEAYRPKAAIVKGKHFKEGDKGIKLGDLGVRFSTSYDKNKREYEVQATLGDKTHTERGRDKELTRAAAADKVKSMKESIENIVQQEIAKLLKEKRKVK